MNIYSNKITTPSMSDIFEKAKMFASDSPKAKYSCILVIVFFLENVRLKHVYLILQC